MPRKPTRSRHHKPLRHWPLTFSPFARSMALAAASKEARYRLRESELQIRDSPSSSGNGFLNHDKDETEQSDYSDDEEFKDGVVQADFVFFDPKPSDFHGVKVLLKTYCDDRQWDVSGFVDLILGQPTVGSVVKIENDEDDGVYAVVSALNLGRYKGNKCMIELNEYLVEVCRDKSVITKLNSLVGEHAQEVGLIVSQRVVNLPPQLLPPLYDALFDEVVWATEDEPTAELQNFFRFKFYLIISKMYKCRNVNPNKKHAKSEDEDNVFIKPEDEIFLQLSSWSYTFPLHEQPVQTRELKNYQLVGLVMAVEASKVCTFRKELHSLIDEN